MIFVKAANVSMCKQRAKDWNVKNGIHQVRHFFLGEKTFQVIKDRSEQRKLIKSMGNMKEAS